MQNKSYLCQKGIHFDQTTKMVRILTPLCLSQILVHVYRCHGTCCKWRKSILYVLRDVIIITFKCFILCICISFGGKAYAWKQLISCQLWYFFAHKSCLETKCKTPNVIAARLNWFTVLSRFASKCLLKTCLVIILQSFFSKRCMQHFSGILFQL